MSYFGNFIHFIQHSWNMYGAQPTYMNVEKDGNANMVFLRNSNAMGRSICIFVTAKINICELRQETCAILFKQPCRRACCITRPSTCPSFCY